MKANEKRVTLVKKIVKADSDFQSLMEELSNYDWDFDGEPVFLDKEDIKNLLTRFIAGSVSMDSVHEWADFLELRDDVDYPEDQEVLLSEVMHDLANPVTEGELTVDRVKQLLVTLQ